MNFQLQNIDLNLFYVRAALVGDLRMKKLLIATAALAMVAGTAQAQSSVTVYGVIDTGYNNLKNDVAGTVTETTAVAGGQLTANGEAATSRFGLRGTEDLGGGMRAHFVIETGIGATAGQAGGGTTLGDRSFWAGIEDAKMGQLRAGRQDTFTRSNWLAHDQLAMANVVGNLAHSTALGSASTASHDPRRIAINYLSPRFNGAQLSLGMTQDDSETTGAAKQKTASGSQVGLSYAAGKFSAGVAYVEVKTVANSAAGTGLFADGDGSDATSVGVPAVSASNVKSKDTSAAASYDFGVAKVAYIYNKRDAKSALSTFSTSNIDRESHAFSVSAPVGKKTVLRAGYGFGDYRVGTSNAAGYEGDIKGMQAAVNYNLSKRTMAYVIYGDESRETSATAKTKSKEYSFGVRHTF
jgi:predicted porin